MGKIDGNTDVIRRSSQAIDNLGFDETFLVPVSLNVESDGTNLKRKQTSLTAKKIVESGTDTYVCTAPIGSNYDSAVWQCKKISESLGTTLITWADGNSSFDNIATDPTTLTYS